MAIKPGPGPKNWAPYPKKLLDLDSKQNSDAELEFDEFDWFDIWRRDFSDFGGLQKLNQGT